MRVTILYSQFLNFSGDGISTHSQFFGAMRSPRAEAKSMIDRLPEDASFEDIQYHLYVLEKIKRGIERRETEGAISRKEAKARLGKWLVS